MKESYFLNLLIQITKPDIKYTLVKAYLIFVTEKIFGCIEPREVALFENADNEIVLVCHNKRSSPKDSEQLILILDTMKKDQEISFFERDEAHYFLFSFADNFQLLLALTPSKGQKASALNKWISLLFRSVSFQIDIITRATVTINTVDDDESNRIKKEKWKQKQTNDLTKAFLKKRNEFLSGMSQEIRNPVDSVLGFQKACSDANLMQINPYYLEEFKNSVKHMEVLFSDIQFYADLTSGKDSLILDKFKLTDLIKELKTEYGKTLADKGIFLSIDLSSCEHSVISISKKYWQGIFYNLMNNALNFTNGGSITVKINISKKTHEKLTVIIQDTGIGLTEENIQHVFDPYYTSSQFLGRTKHGSGLALAIVHESVKKLGGSIKLESKVNVGSQFSISIPISSEDIRYVKYLGTYQSNFLLFKELFIKNYYDFTGFRTITYLKKSKEKNRSVLIIDWETANIGNADVDWIDKNFYKVLIIKTQASVKLPLNVPSEWMVESITMSVERFEFLIK